MVKRFFLAAVIAGSSVVATAENIVGGVGLGNFSIGDLSFSTLHGSIGYKFNLQNGFYLIPELGLATSISSDEVDFVEGSEIEVDRFITLSLKGQYEFDSGAYVFAKASLADLTIEFSVDSFSESESDDGKGYGLGAGYKFNDSFAVEVAYEDFSYDSFLDSDLTSISLKANF